MKPVVRVKAPSQHVASSAVGAPRPRASHMAADIATQAMAGWMPPLLSADAEWLWERDLSVARIRDLTRNDGWVQAGVDRTVDMAFGATFRLNSKPDAAALGISQDEADELGAAIEAKWRGWASDITYRNDVERMLPFAGQIGLMGRDFVQVGETAALLRFVERDGWPYRTAVAVIDCDRVCNPYGHPDDDRMRGGVELDANGAPVAYHVRQSHPGDLGMRAQSYVWDRIPRFDVTGWERPKFLHAFERRRPGQHRGISRIVSALLKMRLLSRYSESEVKAAAINGSVIGTIYSQLGPEFASEALGGDSSGTNWDQINSARAEFYDGRRVLDDARFLMMYPSDRVDLNTTPRQTSGYPQFQTAFLQGFAASLGISYEQLSMDWSRTNYSSARAALNEVWRSIMRMRAQLTWGVAQPVYAAWLEDALDSGEVKAPAVAPDFYDAPAAYAQAEWIGPGRGYVDPVKEAQAAVMRMKARISTLEREVADQGGDYQMVLAQTRREMNLFEQYGVPPPDAGTVAVKDDDEEKKPVEAN